MSGSRGPLTNPLSIRGEREQQRERQRKWRDPKSAATVKQARLSMPAWLPEASRATWRRVVAGLRSAGVPLQTIDAEAVAFYVQCIDGAAEAIKQKDPRLAARFERDGIAWSTQIGASPAARARMGIKPPRETDPDDPWARLDTPGATLNGNWPAGRGA